MSEIKSILVQQRGSPDMSLTVKKGNVLDAEEEYIAQQCNCCTIASKHLAKSMFDRYPYANTYQHRTLNRTSRSIPGTIDIMGEANQKKIINMYAQYYPGVSKYSNDSKQLRTSWFQDCLDKIRLAGVKRLAMPCKIGCGAAGGDWNEYQSMLESFAVKNSIEIVLYDNSV